MDATLVKPLLTKIRADAAFSRRTIARRRFTPSSRRARLRVRSTAARVAAVAAGVVAVLVLAALSHNATVGASWLYPWGLLVTAAATAAVVFASLQPGVLSAALALRPLTSLGRISYGVYLVHWPVFLWLTPERTGLEGSGTPAVALFLLRVGVTLAVAVASFRLLERPVRLRPWC